MHRHSWLFKPIGMILGVLLLSGTVLVTAQKLNQVNQAQSTPPLFPTVLRTPSPTRPANCIPLPQETAINSTLTPTPDRLTSPMPNFRPTVTPRVYTNTFDLSPELPLQDKSEIVVFRCSGTFDLFLAGPEVDIDQRINLEPGDLIISSAPPASLMGHKPPEPPDWPTVTPATLLPYPPPVTSSSETTALFSYPTPATATPGNIEP